MESKQCQIGLRYIIVYSRNILIIFIIKQSDILLYQKLIVPVHMGAHWCLAVVDFVQKEFRYYNSMLGDNMKCLERIASYLDFKDTSVNLGFHFKGITQLSKIILYGK